MNIVEADLNNELHVSGLLEILRQYAAEPGGGSHLLTEQSQKELIERLKEQSNRLVLLALKDGLPIGLAVCFRGFSTFTARPLINIHDLAVLPQWRGHGAGTRLIECVTSIAEDEGCCRVTLEVISDNTAARRLYQRCGFNDPPYGPEQSLSLCKPLTERQSKSRTSST